MDRIIELGISDIELSGMLEQCPSIISMNNKEVDNLLGILRYIGCNHNQVRNIIISNPYYFDRMIDDILKLIMYLRERGFGNLNLLFDMNPFLLNKDYFEIREYVNKRILEGNLLEDIIDEIENNPYIIDEC